MTATVEYVNFLTEELFGPPGSLCYLGFDEPWPLNVSRLIWLMSQRSQKIYEATCLGWVGKN